MRLREMIRDWWRGYSDADRESVRQKLTPIDLRDAGKITWLTHAEMKALIEPSKKLRRPMGMS